jgi:ADP-heptose:LPS heptosyltransferase
LEEVVYTGRQDSLSVNLNGVWYRFPRGVPQPVSGLHAKKLLKSSDFRRFSTFEKLQEAYDKGQSVPIYVRRDSGLGDVLMLTPALREMKRKFSNIELVLSTSKGFTPLLEDLPYIDKLLDKEQSDELEWNSFYSICNLNMAVERMSPNNRLMHRVDQFALLLGVTLDDKATEVSLRDSDEEEAEGFLKQQGWQGEPLVTIQLRGAVNSRTPPSGWWQPLIDKLVARWKRIVFVGHE